MILFISDLHLCASRPATTAAFRRFLAGPARSAEELWILGDLFEFWIGDDDLADPFNAGIADALAQLSAQGVAIRIVPGNRDFLLGRRFARRTGARILREPAHLHAFGQHVVLTHGDAECTQDLAYQRFRRRIRSLPCRLLLRLLPIEKRRQLARQMRERSEATHAYESGLAYDLAPTAVDAIFARTGANAFVHGHTHRPARHIHTAAARPVERWVLADWHEHATWLELGPAGFAARTEAEPPTQE